MTDPRGTATTAPPIIGITDVSVSFGAVQVLKNVTANLPRGVVTGVIGANGAGKTTLLNCISGFVRPSAGEIRIQGRITTTMKPHRLRELGVRRTFQAAQLVPGLPVVENVMLGLHHDIRAGLISSALRLPRFIAQERAARHQALTVLDRLGIADLASDDVAELPYGVQKKVDLARALVSNPDCLLLDEPMAGLVAADKDDLAALLEQLTRGDDSPTVVIVEHDLRIVNRLCQYVVVLDTGTLIADGPPGEILGSEAVVRAYIGTAAQ